MMVHSHGGAVGGFLVIAGLSSPGSPPRARPYRQPPRRGVPIDGDDWTETRESQAITAATVPNSCLAVTIATGDPIQHSAKVKQPVGDRPALCALAEYCVKKVSYCLLRTALKSVGRLPGYIRLHFAHSN